MQIRMQDKNWWLGTGIPLSLAALFLLLVVWQLAGLTVRLFDDPASMQPASQGQPLSQADITRRITTNWSQLQLFGSESSKPRTAPQKNKPTVTDQQSSKILKRLGIKLIGVVASSNPENSYIAINDKGSVDIYRTDDEIRDGVTVNEIRAKEITLSHGDVTEVISLGEGFAGSSRSGSKPAAQRSAPRTGVKSFKVSNPKVLERINGYREALRSNPTSLIGKVRTAAVMRDGEVYGQRLRSGSDRQLLSNIGLRSGDILLSVNGIDVNDVAKLGSMVESLSSGGDSIEVKFERGGRVQNMNILLGQ